MSQSQQSQPHDDFHLEVVANFSGLLDSFDFKEEIKVLNISAFNFRLKKSMILEFKTLYIGLWNMALCQSFPYDHDEILHKFIALELPKKYKPFELSLQITKINQYIEIIQDNPDIDFSPISHHILSLLAFKDTEQRNMSLKIALHVRSVYTYIFERLF